MKRLIVTNLVILSTSLTTAMAGGNASGGGNFEEGDFVRRARNILHVLDASPDLASQTLGIEINQLEMAIKTTQVECAVNDELAKIQSLRKAAYFEAGQSTIFLDCSSYEKFKNMPAINSDIVVFHEYMRALGAEKADYNISSRLPDAYTKVQISNRQNTASPNAPKTCLVGVSEGGSFYYVCSGGDYIQGFSHTFSTAAARQEAFEFVDQLQRHGVCTGLEFVDSHVCNTGSSTRKQQSVKK